MGLEVLHADDTMLVVNKPAGLLAVPGRGADKQDCLATRAQARWPDALVVHRLDMATSGLMLMARGAPMQRLLSKAFAAREVHKRYVALVDGLFEGEAGQIELPIGAEWPNRPMQQVDHAFGKPSTTRWTVLESDSAAGCTRLLLEPVTGRTHQLRVHLQAIGHPILGDALYAPPAVQAASPRLCLHASQLALAHPLTGEAMCFDSAAPF